MMDIGMVFLQFGVVLVFVGLGYVLIVKLFAALKNIGVVIDRQEEIIDLLKDIKSELQKNT